VIPTHNVEAIAGIYLRHAYRRLDNSAETQDLIIMRFTIEVYIPRASLRALLPETVTPAARGVGQKAPVPPTSVSLCGCAAFLSPWFRTASLSLLKRGRVERGRHLAPPNPLLLITNLFSTIKYLIHLQQLGCILALALSILLDLKLLMHPIPTN